MSLVTRCPKCDSGFAVTAALLSQHDGLVRCGQCSHVFDGFACLQDSLPTLTERVSDERGGGPDSDLAEPPKRSPVMEEEEPPTAEPQVFRSRASSDNFSDHRTHEPTLTPAPVSDPSEPRFTKPIPADGVTSARAEPAFTTSWRPEDSSPEDSSPTFSSPKQPAPTPTVTSEPKWGTRAPIAKPTVKVLGETRVRGEDPSASGRTLPDFMVQDDPEPAGPVLLWLGGLILLVVVLLGQLIFIYRDDVASSVPALRPVLAQVCQPFGCEVGYAKRIERIFVVGSSLQQASGQSPSETNQHDYLLRLTLQNRYNQAQPWPHLMVALSDPSGTVVIRKVVAPSEYLPPALFEGPFGAQQEASLAVPLRVEGSPVSGFEIDKFFP